MRDILRCKSGRVNVVDEVGGDDSEEEAGNRKVQKMQDPKLPKECDIQDHNLTHLPFRSWCRHCVRGRGKEMPHKKLQDEPGMIELHADLCFLGDENDPGNTVPVFVMRERTTRMTLAAVVPSKSTNTYITKRIVAFMKEIGVVHGDVLVKTDQEPAIMAIIEEAGRVRAAEGGGRYVIEQSPVGSSASNGIVERAILGVEQQARVLKSALEDRWGVSIGAKHSVVPWLVEYAAVLTNRFEVGKDGKTAFERNKGRAARTLGVEFGEAVLWKRKPVGGALGKFSCMWDDGIYLGIRGSSGEIIIGTAAGAWRTRTIQRKPGQERWKPEGIEMVRWVPWAKKEDDPEIDGEKYEVTRLTPQEVEGGGA